MRYSVLQGKGGVRIRVVGGARSFLCVNFPEELFSFKILFFDVLSKEISFLDFPKYDFVFRSMSLIREI